MNSAQPGPAAAPRSCAELRFAAEMIPCTRCAAYGIAQFMLRIANRNGLSVQVTCSNCGAPREALYPNPAGVDYFPQARWCELGGPTASTLIAPAQFNAELDRLARETRVAPAELGPAAWRRQRNGVLRALTCANELLKFDPADGRAQRERGRIIALLAAHDAELGRIVALEQAALPEQHAPRGELSSVALRRHAQWLRSGMSGAGRLDIADLTVRSTAIGSPDLRGARLARIDLSGSNLSFAHFTAAELSGVDFTRGTVTNALFDHALLAGCLLRGADFSLVKFVDSVITGGSWFRGQFDRGLFRRARCTAVDMREADFGNSALDDATFVDCDLRGAQFSLHTPDLLGTSARARFLNCDLRDTTWEQRILDDAVFADCRMHGMRGKPRRARNIVIERPDVSEAGDGSGIGVLLQWPQSP